MKSQRLSWVIFLVCTALLLSAMAWITMVMLRMERAELVANAMAAHQESLRLALWRMDSWLAPRVAREAARPYTDYQPLAPEYNAYSRMLEPLEAGEVLTASPLLPYQSEYFRLHFQIDHSGQVTSPQAPTAAQLERLPPALMPTEQWLSNERAVDELGAIVQVDKLEACVAAVEQTIERPAARPAASDLVLEHEALREDQAATRAASPDHDATDDVAKPRTREQADDAPRQTANAPIGQSDRSAAEWSKRRENFARNVQDAGQVLQQQSVTMGAEPESPAEVGPLVPIWFGGAVSGQSDLMFVRRVRVAGEELYQGFVCDWPKLRDALLAEIADLFPAAQLVPNHAALSSIALQDEPPLTSLATLPASLEVPAPAAQATTGFTPGRLTAAIAWIVVLAGVGLTGTTLRSSIAFGRKRAQFASAVTHELRTPLTTFKMYTDMLAEDMVGDEAQKRDYLRTLQGESDRLARLVENVLSFARMEDGRQTPNSRTMTVGSLLDRVTPQLERRAGASGMNVVTDVEADAATSIHTDDDAVGQILLNLVDNACKYGRVADGGEIHLHAGMKNGVLALTVRDNGPGIPQRDARHLFQAFRRGTTSDANQPGIGIGLTLSRALSRRLGGDLRLADGSAGGASFELTIPLGVSAS